MNVKPIASAKASVTCSTMFPIALPAISKNIFKCMSSIVRAKSYF